MPTPANPVPERLHAVTPHLVIQGAARAIEFYKQAFGAEEILRSASPDGGNVFHAEIQIGDSVVFLADEFPGTKMASPTTAGTTTVALNIYVADCDALFDRAVQAGGQALMPPAEMFWGDRYAQVMDPFGHIWAIATHKEDVPPEEMFRRAQEFFAKAPGR